jgi:hypothetical protein
MRNSQSRLNFVGRANLSWFDEHLRRCCRPQNKAGTVLHHNPHLICWPILWAVVKIDQLTCLPILFTFLLKRSGFYPSLALQSIERGVVQLPFTLQEQDSTG